MKTEKTKTTQKLPYTPPKKLPYTPPKVTFVPLKLEERLLACAKVPGHPFNLACFMTPQFS
jgi:hypothetical protein